MTFKNIVCITKVTTYDRYMMSEKGRKTFLQLPLLRQETIRESHRNQKDFETMLAVIVRELDLPMMFVSEKIMDKIDVRKHDLVMTCGGDGMFLQAAQRFEQSLLIGCNSDRSEDPKKGSVGALTFIHKGNLQQSLLKLKMGEFHIEAWRRLYALVNGRKLSFLAVNDIFFGPTEPDMTCSFTLSFRQKKESFSSSGLIVATGTGSTAWYHNAGGTPFSKDLNGFGFIVREPNLKRTPAFVSQIISDDSELVIEPHRDGYFVSCDSRQETRHYVNVTDVVRIGLSKEKPVRVVRV